MFYATGIHKAAFMASKPKPQLLHKIAGPALQSSPKKARTLSTQSSMKDAFAKYADYLNNLVSSSFPSQPNAIVVVTSLLFISDDYVIGRMRLEIVAGIQFGNRMFIAVAVVVVNDKRERVVKASRDITMNSKKVIFQVHRISKHNKEEVLEKAEKDLTDVRTRHVSRLVKELQGTDFWKLRRAYSPGVQEYVEAATLCKFCKTGTLLSLAEINATLLPFSDPSLEPLQINNLDYLLGLADLTGELMRLAIGRISDGELEFAKKICRFVRDIYRELTLLVPHMDDHSDMKTKMDTMLQSVMKIENACFGVHVRGSEYMPLLGSDDPGSFLSGVPDIEL